jgi:hypothetical protein
MRQQQQQSDADRTEMFNILKLIGNMGTKVFYNQAAIA